MYPSCGPIQNQLKTFSSRMASAIGIGDASRPEAADWLQLNRGMMRVCNEATKPSIGTPLNVFR
jgi:hypothetical protein